ncbi:MAG TPA: HAMP domain-containing histidine kinase [Firmicutes bacterium]|nr:HAMP domain-containing histidine kinase [Bacillota bacterium]
MKRLTLRVRFTLMASLFLLISCVCLTLLSNLSASRLIDMAEILPPSEALYTEIEPALTIEKSYKIFQKETILATFIIVLAGSVATYLAMGYVLKPVRQLSEEIKAHHANNLDQPISVPQSADEMRDLALSFNQMISELQRSFLLQRQFSADAAHELRTPLSIMQAKLDVFSLSGNSDPEVMQLVAALNRQLTRLTELIEDLLWFSRDLPQEPAKPVELFPLLCDIVDELSNIAEQKEITIQIPQTNCRVQGQDRLLERVFYNLLENALKYSPPQTVVTVSVETKDHKTEISIADQGEGLPEEYRTAVFEPFFRVDKSRSRAIGGSGLGLAVCKKILDLHHATICVVPNTPAGSIFRITFPA